MAQGINGVSHHLFQSKLMESKGSGTFDFAKLHRSIKRRAGYRPYREKLENFKQKFDTSV